MKNLTYEGIRQDLVDSLKKNPVFKDFNFDASGISALVNFLAYNDHRFGYFAKMMLDESFIDSAHTIPAMLSHAKRLGYQARGPHAASQAIRCELTTPLDFPSDIVEVPRGTTFKSTNGIQDTRVFTVLAAQNLTYQRADATYRYFSGLVLAHEGVLSTVEHSVSASLSNQHYSVGDPGADLSTLQVYVKDSQSTVETRLERAASPQDVNPDLPVYYTSLGRESVLSVTTSEGYSQGSKVRIEYLKTAGASGNGASLFAFAKRPPRSQVDINNFSTVSCSVDAPSQGGADPQNIEELRAAIPAARRRQNRAVTADDIASLIREDFGDVSSVNVWGGEEEPRRRYGKKFICVVPKSSRVLSLGGRREITRLLEKYKIPGDDLVFVDATRQLVDITVTVKRLPTAATDSEITAAVLEVIDKMLGVMSGSSVTDFSGYAVSNEILRAVPDVSQAFPSLTFYNLIEITGNSGTLVDFGNDVHSPPNITSTVPVKVTQPSTESLLFQADSPTVAFVTTTPVVPELRVKRNQYFEVRTRKVKVMR